MKNCVCIFPFIEVTPAKSIWGILLQPWDSSRVADLDDEVISIIKSFQAQLQAMGISLEKFSFAFFSNKKPMDDQVDSMMKVADFLRFRLSYETDDFDYDQAMFLLLSPKTEDSFTVSVNGSNPTILDSKSFIARFPALQSRSLDLTSAQVPALGLAQFVGGSGILEAANYDRFWRALDWYSKSFVRDLGLDKRYEIICLAIAFEALLDLPEESIGAAFKSFVGNLFGGSPNLISWVKGFYALRSKIVHGEMVILRRRGTSSKKQREGLPSTYFTPVGTNQEFVESVDIARPVFRDIVESISLIQKKKKQYDYEDVFFTDELRLNEIESTLARLGTKAGVKDLDDLLQFAVPLEYLRGDDTATNHQIKRISERLIAVLVNTFRATEVEARLQQIAESLSEKKIKTGDLWQLCDTTKEKLTQLKSEYSARLPSELHADLLDLSVDWFAYARTELHKRTTSSSAASSSMEKPTNQWKTPSF